MYCIKCGRDLPDDARFCYICGEPTDGFDGSADHKDVRSSGKAGGNASNKRRKGRKRLQITEVVAIVTGLVVCTAVILAYFKITAAPEKPEQPQMPEVTDNTGKPMPSIDMENGADALTTPAQKMPQMPQGPGGSDSTDSNRPDGAPFDQFDEPEPPERPEQSEQAEPQEHPEFDDAAGKLPEGKYKADECYLEKKGDEYYLYPVSAGSTLFQGANDTGITISNGVKISKSAKVGVAVAEGPKDDHGVAEFTYDYYNFYDKADELFSQSHWQYTGTALSFEVGGSVHVMTPVITVNDQGEITEILDFYIG